MGRSPAPSSQAPIHALPHPVTPAGPTPGAESCLLSLKWPHCPLLGLFPELQAFLRLRSAPAPGPAGDGRPPGTASAPGAPGVAGGDLSQNSAPLGSAGQRAPCLYPWGCAGEIRNNLVFQPCLSPAPSPHPPASQNPRLCSRTGRAALLPAKSWRLEKAEEKGPFPRVPECIGHGSSPEPRACPKGR